MVHGTDEQSRFSIWLGLFLAGIFLSVMAILYLMNFPAKEGTLLWAMTNGFMGNLLSGIWTGILFLFLAAHLNATAERNVGRIRSLLEVEHERAWQRLKIEEFVTFLKEQAYHDIRLPELVTDAHPIGLSYTVVPIKDGKEPKMKVTEMERFYLIKVQGPAQEEVLDEEHLLDYDVSPIKEDEGYFCRFYDGAWHMSADAVGSKWYRFYLSGKVGPMEHGDAANVFAGLAALPSNFKKVAQILVANDGTEADGQGSCWIWDLFVDEQGAPYIKSASSSPKRVYSTNTKEQPEDWVPMIENIRGHFGGDRLDNFKEAVVRILEQNGVTLPREQWYLRWG